MDPVELRAAAAAGQASWMRAVASVTGGRVFEIDGVECVHQPVPHGELLIAFPERLAIAGLARIVAWARGAGVDRVGCWVSGLESADLAATLGDRGFQEGWRPHWMVCPLPGGSAPAADPRVARVTEVAEYDSYGQALLDLARGTRPRAEHFVARVDGEFGGIAWLHVADAARGVASVFDVFVPPPQRRRGLGRALTAAVCARAAEIGCGHVVLNATGEGEPLYTALGFRSLGHGRTWWLHGA